MTQQEGTPQLRLAEDTVVITSPVALRLRRHIGWRILGRIAVPPEAPAATETRSGRAAIAIAAAKSPHPKSVARTGEAQRLQSEWNAWLFPGIRVQFSHVALIMSLSEP